jgi:hypothetical protein
VFDLELIDLDKHLANEPRPIKAQPDLSIAEHLRYEMQAEALAIRLGASHQELGAWQPCLRWPASLDDLMLPFHGSHAAMVIRFLRSNAVTNLLHLSIPARFSGM